MFYQFRQVLEDEAEVGANGADGVIPHQQDKGIVFDVIIVYDPGYILDCLHRHIH